MIVGFNYFNNDGNRLNIQDFIIEENGDALLQRVRLIEQAKEEIILSTFAFHDDDSGQIMMGALLRAAERNVHIRILVDGFESWTAMEGNAYFLK